MCGCVRGVCGVCVCVCGWVCVPALYLDNCLRVIHSTVCEALRVPIIHYACIGAYSSETLAFFTHIKIPRSVNCGEWRSYHSSHSLIHTCFLLVGDKSRRCDYGQIEEEDQQKKKT